ncbi:nucleoside-diphosphate kinase [Candidatus Parvarchaeota archaeon]|nr:nucleoside-diphosphate kinase [Candidatus Parvarchaeota archaeon]
MNINMTIQKTFAMIKPDAVRRGLIGKIISRIEEDGFEIVQMRKCRLSSGFAAKLYRDTENQLTNMGKKTIESMTNAGKKEEIRTRFGSEDPYQIGKELLKWARDFMTSSDVVPMILRREDAVKRLRQLVGKTDPAAADKGTIRGDFADDSISAANSEGRAVRNLIHASDEEGYETEISLFEREIF